MPLIICPILNVGQPELIRMVSESVEFDGVLKDRRQKKMLDMEQGEE